MVSKSTCSRRTGIFPKGKGSSLGKGVHAWKGWKGKEGEQKVGHWRKKRQIRGQEEEGPLIPVPSSRVKINIWKEAKEASEDAQH